MRFPGGEALTVAAILEAPREVVAKSAHSTLYRAGLSAGEAVALLRFVRPACAAGAEEAAAAARVLGAARHPNLVQHGPSLPPPALVVARHRQPRAALRAARRGWPSGRGRPARAACARRRASSLPGGPPPLPPAAGPRRGRSSGRRRGRARRRSKGAARRGAGGGAAPCDAPDCGVRDVAGERAAGWRSVAELGGSQAVGRSAYARIPRVSRCSLLDGVNFQFDGTSAGWLQSSQTGC